jgi:hypothetical protein
MADRNAPFIWVSWALLLFGWILMLAATAALQQARRRRRLLACARSTRPCVEPYPASPSITPMLSY